MRYVISPGEGVGSIRFGMSREDVHARLGAPEEEGVWEESDECEDEWEPDGLAVRFDPSGECVEIALFPPATVQIRGVRLLGEHDGDGRAAILGLDPDCTDDDSVVVSAALGLLYTTDDDGVPELILVAPGRLDALAASSGDDEDEDAEDDEDPADDEPA